MTTITSPYRLSGLGALALAISAANAVHARSGPPVPTAFEVATIHVEQNATDGDTEVVMLAKGGDDGLSFFKIRAPDRRLVVLLNSPSRSVMGLREFAFESPEPEGEAILAAYPEGTYTFYGHTLDRERFQSSAVLSHALPPPVTILYPADEAQDVPTTDLLIQWSAAPGIAGYILELENESADPEQSLTINLPADATSFTVPADLVASGADYQVGIATVADNGNVVFVESTFTTAE